MMLISPAYAQAAGGGGSDLFVSLMPLILIFAVFYFLLIRPQQRKVKHHREMLVRLRRGDKVLTGGGIVGTITKVLSDTEVTVQIAEGVKVTVARSTISDVMIKPEPVRAGSSGGTAPAAGSAAGPVEQLKGLFGGFLGGKK